MTARSPRAGSSRGTRTPRTSSFPEGADEALTGVQPAPNIQGHPDLYEIENQAVDPDGLIEAGMWRLAPWAGKTVLDIGCGTGYHLPRLAERAAQVIGVEPHQPSLERAQRRIRGLAGASALRGSAEQLPVDAASVDVAHARFAYFWGPGAEPGLRELERVMRPGGAAL